MGPRAQGDKQGDLCVLAAPGETAGGGDGAVADGISLPTRWPSGDPPLQLPLHTLWGSFWSPAQVSSFLTLHSP